MNINPFTEEHELLRTSFRQFIEKEIAPHVEEWEKNKICDRDIFRKMGEQGFFGVSFPTKYGGSGMDLWSAVVIAEELAHTNVGGLAMSFLLNLIKIKLLNLIKIKFVI